MDRKRDLTLVLISRDLASTRLPTPRTDDGMPTYVSSSVSKTRIIRGRQFVRVVHFTDISAFRVSYLVPDRPRDSLSPSEYAGEDIAECRCHSTSTSGDGKPSPRVRLTFAGKAIPDTIRHRQSSHNTDPTPGSYADSVGLFTLCCWLRAIRASLRFDA